MQRRDMLPSKHLKQTDFDTVGTVLTVSHVSGKQNVAKPDEAPDHKHILFFHEMGEVGLVLNGQNTNFCFDVLGEHSEEWSGQQVVMYVDPNVTFGEKRVGGLRLRANSQYQPPRAAQPRQGAQDRSPAPVAPRAPVRAQAPPPHDDDIPY